MSVGLVDRLEQQQQDAERQQAEQKQAALPGYRTLLLRMAAGTEQPEDAQQLAAAMRTLDLDFDVVRDHAQHVRRLLDLRRKAADLAAQIAAETDAGAQYEQIKRACEDRIRQAALKKIEQQSLHYLRNETDKEISDIQRTVPGLFHGWTVPTDDELAQVSKAPQRPAESTNGADEPQQPKQRKQSRSGR